MNVSLVERTTKSHPIFDQPPAGPVALRVRQASLPVVDDENCTSRINNVTERLFILPVNSFCAGGELANDACNGDGGSGLVCQSDGFYELTGLVSWGNFFIDN